MTYNTNAPNGLQPYRMQNGSGWSGTLNRFPIASAYNTSVYKGDPVIILNDGTVGIGVAGSQSLGVLWGVKYTDTDGVPQFKNRWTASVATKGSLPADALIIDDPNVVFDAQEDDGSGAAGTALALADVNLNINYKIRAGNTTTGISKASLDNTTEATTLTLNCRILGLTPREGNAVGSFANWLVLLNEHTYRTGVVGL